MSFNERIDELRVAASLHLKVYDKPLRVIRLSNGVHVPADSEYAKLKVSYYDTFSLMTSTQRIVFQNTANSWFFLHTSADQSVLLPKPLTVRFDFWSSEQSTSQESLTYLLQLGDQPSVYERDGEDCIFWSPKSCKLEGQWATWV